LTEAAATKKPLPARRHLAKSELAKFDQTPLYFYTEKDGLNRVTVLKEQGKESYLVAGRYALFMDDARLYNPLTDEEKAEVEKLVRMGRKDALISFL
jgi:hypothetical protein